MIEVKNPNKDRGRQLYEMHGEAITAMCLERIKAALSGSQHTRLKTSCDLIDNYIDNTNPKIAQFVSDIAPTTIRKAYWEYIALFSKFLETPPIFSISGSGDKGIDAKRTALISGNNDKTYFKERCLDWCVDQIVRYGTTAVYSYIVDDYNANSLLTVNGYGSETGYTQQASAGDLAVLHMPIHPLNVIMDPRATYQSNADYQGFISDICLSDISRLLDNDQYIAKNVKEAFDSAKESNGGNEKLWHCGNTNKQDFSKGHTTIKYLWSKLNFEGNEDDPNTYAIEIIQDKIVRIDTNNLDGNIIPISTIKIMPRLYDWYGTSVLIDKIPIQNAQYFLTNATIEAFTRQSDDIKLFNSGSIDIGALNSRRKRGGFVPVDERGVNLADLIHTVPQVNNAYRENDYLTQEMRRFDADTSAMPNFNPQNQGGPGGGGQTLGGQQMIASIGELKMGKLVSQMASGLKDIPKNDMALFINGMDDKEPLIMANGEQITKLEIIGQSVFVCNVSNVYNYQREGIDAANRLNMVVNRMATKLPQFQTIRLAPFIEDELRNALKGQNLEGYIDRKALEDLDNKQIQAVMQPPPPPQSPPMAVPQQTQPNLQGGMQ
jgi:hypothetical protein